MFNPRTLIVALALCAMAAGAMAPGLAQPSSAAPAAPKIAVTAHVSTYYLPGSYFTVKLQRLTLHVTGSNFTPGGKVGLALLNTPRWEIIARGATHAQPARIMVRCGYDFRTCDVPNPQAGTIDYRMRLGSVPAAPSLELLYRAGGETRVSHIAL